VILPKVRLLSYNRVGAGQPGQRRGGLRPRLRAFARRGEKVRRSLRSGLGQYFLLSNPILPVDAGSIIARDLIRNTAAVFCS
jgi:hypothetical protein